MQEANWLPALVEVDLEEGEIEEQKPKLRMHPQTIKEGAMLECVRAKHNSMFYTVGKHYKVMSVSGEIAFLEDDLNFPLGGHTWPLDALTGANTYTHYHTQFKLAVWT